VTTITFEQWRRRFEKSLVVRTTAWNSLRTYEGFLKEHPSLRPPLAARGADGRTRALRSIYDYTLPPLGLSEQQLIRDAHIRKDLRRLATHAETFISYVQNGPVDRMRGLVLVTGYDNEHRIELISLLDAYQKAVESSRIVLSLLKLRRRHKLKGEDQGFRLAIILERQCELRQAQAFPLVRLALLAHGVPEDELEDLNLDKIRPGNFRRRKEAYLKRRGSWYKKFSQDRMRTN
jgi:hypothetical protein